MPETKKINYCLNFIKGIACICVVFMHCEFPGLLGVVIQAMSRFCVPFFFMISGYFCYKEDGKKVDVLKKIKHIFKIIVIATFFYLVIELIKFAVSRNAISVSISSIMYFLLFNRPFVIAGQLWFLFALLYDYIIYYLIEKWSLHRLSYVFIPILFCVYIIMAQGAHLVGIRIPNMLYRNFLIEGFPFFMLGHYLHKHADAIRLKNRSLICIFVISTFMCLIERRLLGRDFGVNICTIPQVVSLFIFGVKNYELFRNNIITKLGTYCSLYVYILHPAIWHGYEKKLYKIIGEGQSVLAYLQPIFVLLTTILVSILVIVVVNCFSKIKEVKNGNPNTNN